MGGLHTVIRRFFVEAFTDPYTPLAAAIQGKVSVFNEVTNSGQSAPRRILETAPNVTIPSNNVVARGSEYFIVGHKNVDQWRGTDIRFKYPILKTLYTAKVCSIFQIITNALPSRTVYGRPSFARDLSLELQESELQSTFSFFFPKTESVSKGQIVVYNSNEYYRVRGVPYVDNAGFLVADVVQIESPVQSLSFASTGGYDPTTDVIAVASTTTVTSFVEEAYLFYDNTSERFEEIKPGDKCITCKPATTPKTGDTIGGYRILAVDPGTSAVSHCHCRK